MPVWGSVSSDVPLGYPEEDMAVSVHYSRPLSPPKYQQGPVDISTFGDLHQTLIYPDGTIIKKAREGPTLTERFDAARSLLRSMIERGMVRCLICRNEISKYDGRVCATCVPSQGHVRPGHVYSWAGSPASRHKWRMMIKMREASLGQAQAAREIPEQTRRASPSFRPDPKLAHRVTR